MSGRQHNICVCGEGSKEQVDFYCTDFPPHSSDQGEFLYEGKWCSYFKWKREQQCRCYTKGLARNTQGVNAAPAPQVLVLIVEPLIMCSCLSSLQISLTLSVQLSGLISSSRIVFTSPSEWLGCSFRTPWGLLHLNSDP